MSQYTAVNALVRISFGAVLNLFIEPCDYQVILLSYLVITAD